VDPFWTTQEARLEQFRVVMNWNRDELAQWALAHAQREDDALALEAYRRRVRLWPESFPSLGRGHLTWDGKDGRMCYLSQSEFPHRAN